MARRADHQQFVTVKEAADLLHFSPRRVSQLLKEGRMHGVKPGGRKWVIPRIEIDRLLGHQSMTHRPDADVNNVDFRSLQEHRNELMPALLDVSGIGQLAVHDYDLAVWYFKPDDPCWPIAKGKVCRNRARVRGYVNRCVNDIRRRPSQPLIQWRFHPHTVHRDRRLRSTQGPSDA